MKYLIAGILLILSGYFIGFRKKEPKPFLKITGVMLVFFGSATVFRTFIMWFFNWLSRQ